MTKFYKDSLELVVKAGLVPVLLFELKIGDRHGESVQCGGLVEPSISQNHKCSRSMME